MASASRTERHEDFNVPWCQEILTSRKYTDKSARRPRPPLGNHVTNTIWTDSLFSDTTVRAWRFLRAKEIAPSSEFREYLFLVSLGHGLAGYRDLLHGGVLGLLSDQAAGMCATAEFEDALPVTAECNMKFMSAVPLPSVVLCRTALTKLQGRKLWIGCRFENGKGRVYAESQTLYIIGRTKL